MRERRMKYLLSRIF